MFDRKIYGALLRYQRLAAGYRKGDEFVRDLVHFGIDMPVATLYRIERGDQEPNYSFIAAANLLLFGDMHSGKIVDACVPDLWSNPEQSPSLMSILSKNGALHRRDEASYDEVTKDASYYENLLTTTCSYDFDVFPNGSCDEDHLFMSVKYGEHDLESYEITSPDDVERAIINFLKSYDIDISGEEIRDLIRFGKRKMKGALQDYEII